MIKISCFNFVVALIVSITFYSCQHHPIEPFDGNATTSGFCDPDSVYFNRDIMPIIQQNCAVSGCHGGGSAQDGVDLSSYQGIMTTGDIVPFNPGESDIYDVITETDPDKIMPVPPRPPLTTNQIELIASWINQGALNNSCTECDTSLYTFSGSVFNIIETNCTGCHSGASPSAGISLTNYNDIQPYAQSGALFGVIDHEPGYVPMPYNGNKLVDCEITQVRKWIDNGALND
jgi:uncharacterized membrane protein